MGHICPAALEKIQSRLKAQRDIYVPAVYVLSSSGIFFSLFFSCIRSNIKKRDDKFESLI